MDLNQICTANLEGKRMPHNFWSKFLYSDHSDALKEIDCAFFIPQLSQSFYWTKVR